MAPVGVAIIGSGLFAREQHLPAVEAVDDLKLLAVYSRSAGSAKSLIGDRAIDIYSDDSGKGKAYKDLLTRDEISAVIIVLPIPLQPKFIKEALLANKHVLSEKPIAENLKEACDLIEWYQGSTGNVKATWSVAENFRFMNSLDYARMQLLVQPGGKYYETEWRKNPTYQGGFLTDGGVHAIAAIRSLLGSDRITRLAAFSAQLQSHLPPIDTIEAAAKTANGALGSISLSFGTTARGNEWVVACEGGSVSVSREVVRTEVDGKEEVKNISDEGSGVPPEIRAWAKGLRSGQPDERQSIQEAVADLELIDAVIRSGEGNGSPVDLIHQEIRH